MLQWKGSLAFQVLHLPFNTCIPNKISNNIINMINIICINKIIILQLQYNQCKY